MSRHLVFSFLVAALSAISPGLQAQSPQALKVRFANHQKRADMLKKEIRELDARIEERLERALKAIEGVKDTEESRTHVARLKGDVLAALKSNIERYRRKRVDLEEEMRNPRLNITPDEKRKGIAMLNSRIDKRIAQVIRLAQSFPGSEDVPKYAKLLRADDDDIDTLKVVNEDWRQNQRVSSHTRAARGDIEDELKKSIGLLERQQRDTKARLATFGAAAAPAMEEEIARTGVLIETRKRQLAELDAAGPLPAMPLNQKESIKLIDAVKELGPDLRRDVDAMFARYNELLVELSRTRSLEAALVR